MPRVTNRPRIPSRPEYGAADSADAAAPATWDQVRTQVEAARYYWLVTTGAEGRPHAVPVWAVWLADELFFASDPTTASMRNIARAPDVLVHLESAADVVVIDGRAARAPDPAPPSAAYEAKYGWRLDPDDAGMVVHVVTPRSVSSWKAVDVRGTAIRWRFGSPEGSREG